MTMNLHRLKMLEGQLVHKLKLKAHILQLKQLSKDKICKLDSQDSSRE